MVGQGLNNNKGFSLLELLIAMVIIIVVMLGLLRGILEYEKFTTRAKMKDKATEIAKQMVAYIESLPYVADNSGVSSILYANNVAWKQVICTTTCSFFETETDFYSVGSPSATNPLGISSNLRLSPRDPGNPNEPYGPECTCRGSNCPNTNLPLCTYAGFSDKKIYVGVNIASLYSEQGNEIGKAASVMVWYFEPFTNKYQQITNLVIREKR